MANHLEKWGRATARERYGKVKSDFGKTESNQPQFEADSHGPNYDNDVPADGWLRKKAESKPGYVHTGRRGK